MSNVMSDKCAIFKGALLIFGLILEELNWSEHQFFSATKYFGIAGLRIFISFDLVRPVSEQFLLTVQNRCSSCEKIKGTCECCAA